MRRYAGTALAALAAAALVGPTSAPAAARQATQRAPGPTIITTDVDRFYALYDRAGGHPDAAQLQAYIDTGSSGLRHFAAARRTTGARIAAAIAAHPEVYADARRCAAVLPRVRPRLDAALRRLARLYPEARFPPITVVIGRGRPVAIGSPSGAEVGLEALCAVRYLDPNLEDRFLRVLVHEFAHTLQSPVLGDVEHPSVLRASLAEGVAEFVTELVTGDISYSHLRPIVAGRETEIERAFLADKDKTDLGAWLYNGSLDRPGDLGYWVGYRIVKAYYRNAPDKRRALREIFQMTDPDAFLAASGWHPGMSLRTRAGGGRHFR